MNPEHVLIILIAGSPSASMHSEWFGGKDLCETAAQEIKRDASDLGLKLTARCYPTNSLVRPGAIEAEAERLNELVRKAQQGGEGK